MTSALPPPAPNIGGQLAQAGGTLATLNDWRAILFTAVGIIVFLGLLIVWVMVINARKDAMTAKALNSIADNLAKLTVEIRITGRVTRQRLREKTDASS